MNVLRRVRWQLGRLSRVDRSVLRAAAWSFRAVRHVRRELPREGLANVVIDAPPELPPRAVSGVEAAAWLQRATCLERSLVVQSWLAAHGRMHDIVIGVGEPGEAFAAHAWVHGYDRADEGEQYHELTRVAPR